MSRVLSFKGNKTRVLAMFLAMMVTVVTSVVTWPEAMIAKAESTTAFELYVDDLDAGEYTESFVSGGFTITATAAATVTVDSSAKKYNGVTYTNRLKTGGEGNTSQRSIKFTTTEAATVNVLCMSSNSSTTRTLALSDGTNVDFTASVPGSSLAMYTFNLSEAGEYYLYSTSGGINFYYIGVVYGQDTESDDTEQVEEIRERAPEYKAGDLYVSAKGSSTATGSFEDPMDLPTAISKIQAGNTIWMFSGTYNVYQIHNKGIVIEESNSGTANAYKTISSINNKTVTLDFKGMAEQGANRGIVLDGSYWKLYDIDICNAGDNGMLLSGDYNIIELCQFYKNHDTGLQISRYNSNYSEISQWPSFNQIINCTSYNNKDEATAENADGFAPKLTCGEGNIFDGCISYCNSDDGWDLYAKPETGSIGVVTLRNCVAFGNGKLTDGTGSANGDMNGFKLGGSSKQCPTPHIVENCLAFNNGATGFTDNGNGGAMIMKNCTSANNGVFDSNKANYMCYRTSADAEYSNLISYAPSVSMATDQFLGTVKHSLYHYKSLSANNGYYWVNSWTCTDGAKTKYSGSEAAKHTVKASDFVSVTVPGYNATTSAYAADYHTIFRNADGSINMNGLYELTETSPLNTAGVDGGIVGVNFGDDMGSGSGGESGEESDDTYVGNVNTELQKFSYDDDTKYLSGQIVVVEWVDNVSTVPKYKPVMTFDSTDGTESIEVFVTPTGTNTYYFDRLLSGGLTDGKEYVFHVTSGDPNNVSEYKTVPVYTGTSGIGSEGVLGEVNDQQICFKTGTDGSLLLYGADVDHSYVGDVNSSLLFVNCVTSELGNFVSGNIVVTEWINGVSTVPQTTPVMTFESVDKTEKMDVFMKCLDGTNTYYFDRNLNEDMDVNKEYIFTISLTEENNVSDRKSMVVTTNYMDVKEGVLWETATQTICYKTVWADNDNQLRVYAVNK